jgi:hypothetical protein
MSCIMLGPAKDSLRARARYDQATGKPIFKTQELVELHKQLVCS